MGRKKKEDRSPKIVIGADGKPCIALWREIKAIEVLKELLYLTGDSDISLFKVGKEMVRRGYTKDPRYVYKRLWYLKQEPKQPVSEPWKRSMINKYGYIPDKRTRQNKHINGYK